MKQNNYIGYKVPKTLKYESIEIRNDLNKIPELANFNDFYYIFYNERLKNYIIPQKVNKLKYNTSEKDSINITRFLTYLKKLKYDKVNGVLLKKECEEIFILPILNLVKDKYIQSCIDNYLDISNDIKGFCLLQDRFEESFKEIFEKDFNYFKINYN